MKLLAFTDIHASRRCMDSIKKMARKVDLLVCTGDISIFGHGLEEVITFLGSLKKPVVLVHGNHEDEEEMHTLCSQYKNLYFIHEAVLLHEELAFLGYGGGGFATTDPRFEKVTKKMLKEVPPGKKIILLLHQPPYGVEMDMVYGDQHVGNKSFTKFLKSTKEIQLALCGHIHEGFNTQDKIGDCTVINPGNMGTIIEI